MVLIVVSQHEIKVINCDNCHLYKVDVRERMSLGEREEREIDRKIERHIERARET